MDEADQAQIWEERERQAALEAASNPRREELQLVVGGVVWCLDCQLPIPVARLRVAPAAVRCIECASARERHLAARGRA